MMKIILKEIEKSFKGNTIFRNISLSIHEGDKIGLIGVNGIGKTTIIKILMGEEIADSGKVIISPEYLKIGYLKQFNEFEESTTVSEKLNSFTASLSTRANNSNYGKKLKDSLIKLGFKERDLNKKISKLSEGEKTKLSLCMALSENPDMLVLDEPTNHLDIDSIKWLEEFLNSVNKTMLIVSHDRLFLDNTVNKIFEMERTGVKEYNGNYTAYKLQKEHSLKSLKNEKAKQEKEIKKLKKVIDDREKWHEKASNDKTIKFKIGNPRTFKCNSTKHASILRSNEKHLKKLKENKVEIPKESKSASFDFINKKTNIDYNLPKFLIKVNRLKKSFGNRIIFNNGDFNIKNNDKIALIGKNGSGKTTLLKILLEIEKQDSGTVDITSSLKIGYFSQQLENLNFKNTILQEILSTGIDKNEGRKLLGKFLFRGKDVFKVIGSLSMGEKCRVAFAKLNVPHINMLILDEPTNHMNILSKESVEKALKDYSGAIIFVSHDRYFINSIANRVFEIENQSIKIYEGNYKYYLERKEEDKKKEKLGDKYINIKDEIIKLECEMAFLSSKLKGRRIDIESEEEDVQRFFHIAEKLKECKIKINSN